MPLQSFTSNHWGSFYTARQGLIGPHLEVANGEGSARNGGANPVGNLTFIVWSVKKGIKF